MNDQKLIVEILSGNVIAHHKTGMVDVGSLVDIGNEERRKEGKKPFTIPRIRQNKDVQLFVGAVESQVRNGEYSYYETPESLIYATSRGRGGKTIAFLPIALKIASILSATFEAELYRVFIEGQLLRLRDDGGNSFKRLNNAIDLHLGGREGKTSNRGCYIQSAKLLRAKIFTQDQLNDAGANIWNTKYADKNAQKLRVRYEDRLIAVLELTPVKDFSHLKELIDKL